MVQGYDLNQNTQIIDLRLTHKRMASVVEFYLVLMTLGELILVPTATTYAANQAPADMRGRYMSLYSLTRPAASGTGPLLEGQ